MKTITEIEIMAYSVEKTFRENGCMSVTQVCGLYARKHNLNQTERDYLQSQVEFWVGKKKA